MTRLWLALVLLAGCLVTPEQPSAAHLRALGFHVVTCNPEGRSVAICTADAATFRCAVAAPRGCDAPEVACERMTLERP